MTSIGILQIAVFFGVLLLLTKPVGLFMARLFQGERTFLHPVLRPVEMLIYRLCGVQEDAEQRWTQYAGRLLAFQLLRLSVRVCTSSGCRAAAAQSAGLRREGW